MRQIYIYTHTYYLSPVIKQMELSVKSIKWRPHRRWWSLSNHWAPETSAEFAQPWSWPSIPLFPSSIIPIPQPHPYIEAHSPAFRHRYCPVSVSAFSSGQGDDRFFDIYKLLPAGFWYPSVSHIASLTFILLHHFTWRFGKLLCSQAMESGSI